MIYPFESPYNDTLLNRHFVQRDSGLTGEEIDRVRAYGDALTTRPVKLYGEHNETHVKASGADFPLNDETRWLYEKMTEAARFINARFFQYDLTGFHENFYFLSYEAPGEHFNWHVDIGGLTPAPRKLSLTLQLSDPSEYEGGDFDVLVATDHQRAEKARGLITAFPSYKIHRVTPVTAGRRRALTMFLVGPNFR